MRKAVITTGLVLGLATSAWAQSLTLDNLKVNVSEARIFKTPHTAMSNWGDPEDIDGGAYAPMLWFRRGGMGWIVLDYNPPAARHRLAAVYLVTNVPSKYIPLLHEWFGKPARIEKGKDLADHGRQPNLPESRWVYNAKDTARIRLRAIWWHTPPRVWLEFEP